MFRPPLCLLLLTLSACHHPGECAVGIYHEDCLAGTAGYREPVGDKVAGVRAYCESLYSDPALDPIRNKVALESSAQQTLAMRTDQSRPTADDKVALTIWDHKRQDCEAYRTSVFANRPGSAVAIETNATEATEQLIAELYSGKISYGQFATDRSDIHGQALTSLATAQQDNRTQNLQALTANQAILNQATANTAPQTTVQIISPPGTTVISPIHPGAPTGALAGYQYAQDRQLHNQLLQQQIDNQKAINQQLSGQ